MTATEHQIDSPVEAEDGDRGVPRHFWFLVLLWAALLPIQFPILGVGQRRGLHLALSDLVLVAAIVVGGRWFRVRRGAWSAWHVFLPIALTISALFFGGAITRYSVGNKIVGVIVLLLSYALVTSFATSWHRLRELMRVFVLGVVAVNAVTAAALLADIRLPLTTCHSSSCIRLNGYFHDANLFGALVVVALAMHLATMGTQARLIGRGVPSVFVVVSLTGGLVLSLSRSSWIGMAVVVVMLVAFKRGGGSRITIFGGVALVGLFTYVIAGQSASLLRTATRAHSIDSRLEIVENALAAFSESPVFGIGLGSFAQRHNEIVHNTALWFAAELGVIGLIIFVGLMLWVGRRLVRLYLNTTGPEQAIVLALGLAHGAMFSFSFGVEALYQRHWWLVMGLLGAAFSLDDTASAWRVRSVYGARAGLRRSDSDAVDGPY